jgi:protease I
VFPYARLRLRDLRRRAAARAPDSDSEEDAMANELQGKRVAILAADMFEQIELVEPRKALEDAGATVEIVSLEDGEIQGFDHFDPADRVAVDRTVEEASADEYDALMLPGGVGNPDQLRADENAVAFVRDFFRQRKPVAAICHAPWTLIEAGVVQGRTMTSWPSLQTDLRNAGAEWVDREVVVEDGLVLSRKPDDIPAFNRAMIEEFAEGTHARQGAHVGSEAAGS